MLDNRDTQGSCRLEEAQSLGELWYWLCDVGCTSGKDHAPLHPHDHHHSAVYVKTHRQPVGVRDSDPSTWPLAAFREMNPGEYHALDVLRLDCWSQLTPRIPFK